MLRASLSQLALAGVLCCQVSHVDEAWELVAKGDRAGAIQLLEQTLQGSPRNGEALLLLGSIYAEGANLSRARECLERAVQAMPASSEAHNALGELLRSTGEKPAARDRFAKAVRLNPNFAQARVNLAEMLAGDGDAAAAAEHLDRALQQMGASPESGYALYLRAKLYTDAGQVEKAVASLKRAVAVQPDYAEAWSDLGQAYKTLLDDDAALTAFQRSVDLGPANSISLYRLGAEYLRRGDSSKAVAHLQKSSRVAPDNQSTLYSLQLALRQNGQLEEAKAVKERLAKLLRNIDEESRNAFRALRLNNEGAAFEKAGNLKAAAEKYQNAVDLDPEHTGFRVNLGAALLRLGQKQNGISALREALRRDPGNVAIQRALDQATQTR